MKYPGDDYITQQLHISLTRKQFVNIAEFDHPSIDLNRSHWVFKADKDFHYQLENTDLFEEQSANSKFLLGLTTVEFNITDLCNRKCWMCPHHNEELFPNNNVFMELETVKNTVDNLKKNNYVGTIIFGSYGEPLLHPKILEMIEYVSKNLPKCETNLITNGDRFIKGSIPGYGPFNAERLKSTGLTSMLIDCYDDDERLAKYLKEIKSLVGILDIEFYRRYYKTPTYLDRAGLMDPYTGKRPTYKHSFRKPVPCWYPITKSFIDYDGSIRACCHNWERTLGSFGNVNDTAFSELWMHSESLNELRKSLIFNRTNSNKTCKHCSAAGLSRQKKGIKIAELWKPILKV